MRKGKWKTIAKAGMNGDVLITDPCYIVHGGEMKWDPDLIMEWIRSNGGLVNDTYYGDWGCGLFKLLKPGAEVGKSMKGCMCVGDFCADAGLVCVIHMSDVLKISPGFSDWLSERPWCGTVVKDFSGIARLVLNERPAELKMTDGTIEKYTDRELRVRLDGKMGSEEVSLESMQTGA